MAEQGMMISADSHVIEPRKLWVERMNAPFRDRAPQVMTNPGNLKGEWFVCEGLEPRPASLALAAGKDPSEYNEFQKRRIYDDGLPVAGRLPHVSETWHSMVLRPRLSIPR